MKTLLTLLTLLTLSTLQTLFTLNSFAQWQPDVRLTNNPALSFTSTNAWCVAASGDVVHVVWYDRRDGNWETYYKRSTDAGINWGTDTRLTNNSADSWLSSVSVWDSVVHVVWQDYRDGNFEIYYKRSPDAGLSWSVDTRLTNNSDTSRFPCGAVSGQAVHVVWFDDRDGNDEIYSKRSTDAGVNWGADTRLTSNPSPSQYPSVSVSGSTVHIVWQDGRDGNDEIYYKRSIDGGINWQPDTRLTIDSAASQYPSVSVSGSVVHVVWFDDRDGNDEIYSKRSTDGGISWGADTRLTSNSAGSLVPSLSVSGSVVHVVWSDTRDGNYETYYKRSTDAGVTWEPDARLTNNSAVSAHTTVSASGSVVHVVWRDDRDGNYEIYYKRDPTGNPIGIININSEIPNQFSLSQNYPNPFNPTTKIRFALAKSSFAKIVVYDMLGREIETLVSEQLNAGTYEADWNADKFSSGVYYYKLTIGEFSETRKAVLIK